MSGVAVLTRPQQAAPPIVLRLALAFPRLAAGLFLFPVGPLLFPVAWVLGVVLHAVVPRWMGRRRGGVVLTAAAVLAALWVRHGVGAGSDGWWLAPLRDGWAYQRPFLWYGLASSRAGVGYDPHGMVPDWPLGPLDALAPVPFPSLPFGLALPSVVQGAWTYAGHALGFSVPLALAFAAVQAAVDAAYGTGPGARSRFPDGAPPPGGAGGTGTTGSGNAGDAAGFGGAAGRAARPVNARTAGRPAPIRWLVKDAVPAGHVTIAAGSGGVGKSTIALDLAVRLLLGLEWLGRSGKRITTAVVVEAELPTTAVAELRGWAIAKGLGLARPPKGLHYVNGYDLPLIDPVKRAELLRRIRWCFPWYRRLWARLTGRRCMPDLIVYDSLTTGGGLGTSATDALVTEVFKALEQLGSTVVAIDHVTKASAGDWRNAEPFGSAFKKNKCRSMIMIGPADPADQQRGAAVELFHKKTNFGRPFGSVCLAMATTNDPQDADLLDTVCYSVVGPTAAPAAPVASAPAAQAAPTPQEASALPTPPPAPSDQPTVRSVLAEFGGQGVSVDVLASRLGLAKKTVQNRLSTMRKAGAIVDLPGRLVCLRDAGPSESDADAGQ